MTRLSLRCFESKVCLRPVLPLMKWVCWITFKHHMKSRSKVCWADMVLLFLTSGEHGVHLLLAEDFQSELVCHTGKTPTSAALDSLNSRESCWIRYEFCGHTQSVPSCRVSHLIISPELYLITQSEQNSRNQHDGARSTTLTHGVNSLTTNKVSKKWGNLCDRVLRKDILSNAWSCCGSLRWVDCLIVSSFFSPLKFQALLTGGRPTPQLVFIHAESREKSSSPPLCKDETVLLCLFMQLIAVWSRHRSYCHSHLNVASSCRFTRLECGFLSFIVKHSSISPLPSWSWGVILEKNSFYPVVDKRVDVKPVNTLLHIWFSSLFILLYTLCFYIKRHFTLIDYMVNLYLYICTP